MIDDFLNLGFSSVGQFSIVKNQLDFERIHVNYNPANIIYAVLTDRQPLYVGETEHEMNIVLKDLINGNTNRATRDRIHLLIKENVNKCNVYFLVDSSGLNSKENLIRQFNSKGNINGK
jgi:hypothetical protein